MFDRPLRKDPLLWLLALSPVLGFQTAYVYEERWGSGVDNAGQWGLQIVLSVLAVATAVVLLALLRLGLRRAFGDK